MVEKNDIRSEQDISWLVDNFYQRVREDSLIGPIFASKIAEDEWPKHLAKMKAFWSTILHGAGDYRGQPFAAHASLPVDSEHFDRWEHLWKEIIRSKFNGSHSDELIRRAHMMRLLFESKLEHLRDHPRRRPLS